MKYTKPEQEKIENALTDIHEQLEKIRSRGLEIDVVSIIRIQAGMLDGIWRGALKREALADRKKRKKV